jgi:peptidoglycan DL-endopeptidase CwlO
MVTTRVTTRMLQLLALLAGLSLAVSSHERAEPADASGAADAASPGTAAPVSTGSHLRGARARVVAAARRHVGKRFKGDCSGFVRRVYAEAGLSLPPNAGRYSASESMFHSLAPVRVPRPGDLAFFHRTHDREAPGPGHNRFTHVALVESVHGPRVTLIHRGSKGIQRLAMNLARPTDPDENGALRRHRPGDSPRQRYLASELFAGFATASRGELRAGRASRAAATRGD